MINLTALSLTFLNGENFEANRSRYSKAFELWQKVWSETFRELDNSQAPLMSDDYTRQHEILSLFYENECVALICHRYVDAENPAIWSDSYFRAWPPEAKDKLKAGRKLVIGSQITIHPDFRGRESGMSFKELIVYCSLTHLNNQNVDAITGVMRADKGMNTLFYSCGAQPIVRGIQFHNVPVDLVGFFPKAYPIRIPQSYQLLVSRLLTDAKGKKAIPA